MLIHVGGKQEKNPLKDSWDASGFFHDKPSPFPMSNGGNWPLCLYEAVSGRNAGFSQRGDGRGKSMITPTPFRFMVKTEGLLWMHVRGLVEHRPSTPGLPRQMFSRTAPRYSLHPSLSFSSVCLSPSYGKVSPVGWNSYTALCVSIWICTLGEQELQCYVILSFCLNLFWGLHWVWTCTHSQDL